MTLIMDKIYSFHKNKNNQYHDFLTLNEFVAHSPSIIFDLGGVSHTYF